MHTINYKRKATCKQAGSYNASTNKQGWIVAHTGFNGKKTPFKNFSV